MDKKKLIKQTAMAIRNRGLINVAKEVGISVGHLHHIVFHADVYPLTDRMAQKLKKLFQKDNAGVAV